MKRGVKVSLIVSAVLCSGLLLVSASSGATGGSGASRLFVRGANLCKLVSTAKLEVATGLKLPPPVWGGVYCRWELSPGVLRDSVWLSVRRGLGRKGVEAMNREVSGRRVTVTDVTVPGASYASLVTAGYRGMVREWVAAVYPEGTVLVAVTAPGLTAAKAIAAATAVIS